MTQSWDLDKIGQQLPMYQYQNSSIVMKFTKDERTINPGMYFNLRNETSTFPIKEVSI